MGSGKWFIQLDEFQLTQIQCYICLETSTDSFEPNKPKKTLIYNILQVVTLSGTGILDPLNIWTVLVNKYGLSISFYTLLDYNHACF